MTFEQALAELKEGNRRFRENRMAHPRMHSDRIRETALEQHPFAVILTCADSRVAPEIVFDQGLGDLFTVRVAGNVANPDEIASMQYALDLVHPPLCLVMGHVGCGAVQAVLCGIPAPPVAAPLFRQIEASLAKARRENPQLSGADLANAAVRINVLESVEILRANMRDSLAKHGTQIAGSIYRMDCGEVIWLDAANAAR